MKFFTLLFGMMIAAMSTLDKPAPKIKVAIIDTGINIRDYRVKGRMCANPGWDSVTNKPVTIDTHGHGMHVAGLIIKYAKEHSNYCLMAYRYYKREDSIAVSKSRFLDAIRLAIRDGATLINISGGGSSSDVLERKMIKENPHITFVVAAGNENKSTDVAKYKYYPGSYGLPNIIVVGGMNKTCTGKSQHSNYGSTVNVWELGVDVRSYTLNYDVAYMSGTSMATAIHTGKILAGDKYQGCTVQKAFNPRDPDTL